MDLLSAESAVCVWQKNLIFFSMGFDAKGKRRYKTITFSCFTSVFTQNATQTGVRLGGVEIFWNLQESNHFTLWFYEILIIHFSLIICRHSSPWTWTQSLVSKPAAIHICSVITKKRFFVVNCLFRFNNNG